MNIGKAAKGLLAASLVSGVLLTLALVIIVGSETSIHELSIPFEYWLGIPLMLFIFALLLGSSLGVLLLIAFRFLKMSELVSSLLAGFFTGFLPPFLLNVTHGGIARREVLAIAFLSFTGIIAGLTFWFVMYRKPEGESEATILKLTDG